MNVMKLLVTITIAATVQGCATGVLKEEKIRFSGDKSEFIFVKSGCFLKSGQFTDRSGQGKSFPLIKFIAVSDGGKTIGEWRAFCRAVAPNGTSDCDIRGEGRAYDGGGGMGCPDFQNFRIVN